MKIKFKTIKRIISLITLVIFFLNQGSVFIILNSFFKPKKVAAATLTKNTQSDWVAGSYEYGEVDINTTPGTLKKQLDLGSWNASGPANFNHNISTTPTSGFHTKMIKVGRFLYVFRNRQLGQFYRYNMDSRKWEAMKDVPAQPYEVLDATTNGTDTIWVFATRSGKKHFMSYSITNNTWSTLSILSYTLNQGASLEYIPNAPEVVGNPASTANYIYAFRGGNTTFLRYKLSGTGSGQWSNLTNATMNSGTYSDMLYDGSTYLYVLSDTSNDYLYRYKVLDGSITSYYINSNLTVNAGSDMVRYQNNIYFLKTGGNASIMKFNGSTFSTDASLPFLTYNGSLADDTTETTHDPDAPRFVVLADHGAMYYYYPITKTLSQPLTGPPLNALYTGQQLTTDGSTAIYLFRGQGTGTFYKNTVGTGSWGSAITMSGSYTLGAAGTATSYNTDGLIYAMRGSSSTAFYSINPSNGTTTPLTTTGLSTFGDGGAMVSSGSATLFALRGANTATFYKYTGGAWSTKTNITETVGRGGGLVKTGDHLYALTGTNRGGFYRYEETGNAWYELPKLPVGAYTGASMATDGTNYIYVMVGGENDVNGRQFYRFSVSGNSWTRLADTPQMIRSGAGLVYYNSTLYAYQGTGSGFYKYTPPTGAPRVYTPKVRSNWVSPVYDLNSITSFDSFSKTDNTPDGTSIEYWIRTSSNQYNWEDWVQITDANINATVNRYFQLKIVLVGDATGEATPSVTEFNVEYTPDTAGPDVTGVTISGYSAKGSSTALTSGETYNYYNPYFTWPAAATDAAGVAGYNVYFGTEADPSTGWAFQQDNQYVVTTGMTQGELYYLIVKAKDKLGNLSSALTFEYNYNGVSPTSTASVTTQADWDDNEASKSAVYTGSASWWNQSYGYRKQLTIDPADVATAGALVKINIDTDALVTAGKLRTDRADWRVVYNNGNNWEEIDRDYIDATTTYFALQHEILATKTDTNYYVYYGNPNETTSPLSNLVNSKSTVRLGTGSQFFDGTNDYVQLPAAYTTDLNGESAITIEGWFYYINSVGTRCLYGRSATNSTAVCVTANQNYLTYYINAGSYQTNTGTTYFKSGAWNHFAMTYDAATGVVKGYLNGRLDFTRTGMTGNISASTVQQIGNYNGSYFYGYLDEFRISRVVRYSSGFTPSTSAFVADGANTIALYHFEEASGQTLTDSSGSGYHATLGSGGTSDTSDPIWLYQTTASLGEEETVPTTGDNSITLEPMDTGSWAGYQNGGTYPWGARQQYGASVYANGDLYVLRGRGSYAFYKLDLDSGVWTQLADITNTAYYGSAMAWDGSDSIYALRGTASSDFYKYTISTNTWSTPTGQPTGVTFSYGAALIKGKSSTGEDVLYALRGGAQYDFVMYYLTGDNANTWSALATFLYPVYYGAGIVYDDNDTPTTYSDDIVWGVGGYGNSYFAKYSVSGNSWDADATSPPQIPYMIGYASNNLVMKDNYLYTFTSYDYQANNEAKKYIWRYDKTNDIWESVNTDTEFWAYTGAVAYDGSRYVYLIQGYDTTTYYGSTAMTRFDLNTYKFNPETPPLPIDRNYTFYSTTNNDGSTVVHSPYTGTSLASDQSDNVYFFQGGTSYVNKYTISTKRWTILPNLPCLYYGSAVHTGTDLYVVCGNNTQTFLKYDPINTKWVQMANTLAIINGAGNQTIVYDGANTIYLLRGYNTTTVYTYSISGNSWDTLGYSLPAAVGTTSVNNSLGASITFDGTYLYVAQGNNSRNFYRYNTTSPGAWETLSSVPENVYYGSGSIYNNGKIYLTPGNQDNNYYIYNITAGSWSVVQELPSYVYAGSALTKGPGNSAYLLQGIYGFTLWKFNIPSSTSSYKHQGTYTSKSIDLSVPYAFAGLSATVASPSATSISFETRTSTDSADWTTWTTATDLKEIDKSGDTATFSLKINSDIKQYIQVRTTLNSEESAATPTVSNLTVEYYTDTTAPTNPDTLLAYETATKAAGQTLIDSQWYNKSAPYFEWTGAEEVSGGSGIKGYWVYFGSSQTANASSSGTFTEDANYTASLETDGSEDGEYYLRIQTEDNAGNYSSENWQPLHYRFDSQAPNSIGTITADPRTYTYTNSFDMSWTAITDKTSNATSSGLLGYYYQATDSANITGDTHTTETTVANVEAYLEGANTFRVKAKDNAGNETSYTNATFYYNVTPPSAPTDLGVDTTNAGANKFNFTWGLPTTYKGSISEYRYSVEDLPSDATVSTTSARIVTNVRGTKSGTNTFYVVAVDEAGNIDYDNYASITFDVNVTAPGIPLNPEAFDNSIRSSEQYQIGLTWDKPTTLGSAFDRYEIFASTTDTECSLVDLDDTDIYFLAGSTAGTSSGGSFVVQTIDGENLESTTYYLCIRACSSNDQCSGGSTTISLLPSGRWLEAPSMTASPSATVKTKSATIEWTTDRTANSFVQYGTTSGDYGNEVGSSTQAVAHEVDLTELKPGTTYYYKVKWVDEDGNEGISDEYSFSTNAAPLISNVKFTNTNINSTYVNFTIANAIKATINYGKTSAYGSTSSLTTSKTSTSYTVLVDGLTEGTTYHLKIDGEDDEANIYSSDDYTFDTLPTPKISGLRLQQVVGMPTATLRLIWTTNTLASSIVTYYPTKSPASAVDQISLALKKNHEVILKNLLDDTDYTLVIKGKDSIGNETKSETKTLKTATDIRAPEIINMNVESSVTGVGDEAKAQIIVTWDTDETGTTQVEYAQGTGANYGQTTQEDTNKTTNHTVTITGLIPAKIYHLRALSKDKSGNVGMSFDTVIITPKSTKDALNLVIENLAKTFGFLNNLSIIK